MTSSDSFISKGLPPPARFRESLGMEPRGSTGEPRGSAGEPPTIDKPVLSPRESQGSVPQHHPFFGPGYPKPPETSPFGRSEMWRAGLTPQDAIDQEDFLDQCTSGLDQVLEAMACRGGNKLSGAGGKGGSARGMGFVDSHPLATAALEAVLMARELFNCWTLGALHDVAISSLQRRLATLRTFVADQRENWPLTEGPRLFKLNKRKVWQERTPSYRLNELYFKGSRRMLDLDTVECAKDVYTGYSSEFTVQFNSDYKGNESRVFNFKAENDVFKQWWMSLFRLQWHQRVIRESLARMTVSAKARVLLTSVFHKRKRAERLITPDNIYETPLLEFIFATTHTDPTILRAYRELVATNSSTADRRQHLGAIKERFKVRWAQTIGKDKIRELEVDLSQPRRFLVYKPNKSGVIEDMPHLVFTRDDLIGYKCDGVNFEVLFDPRKKDQTPAVLQQPSTPKESEAHEPSPRKSADIQEFKRKFTFESAMHLGRMRALMQMFTQPFKDDMPTLLYQDWLNTLDRQDFRISRQETGGFSFGSQLHSLLVGLTEMAPENTHCLELKAKSEALPTNSDGDLERVKLLVRKFYAFKGHVSSDSHLSTICMCHENKCVLLLYRCLIKAQALGDFVQLTRGSNRNDLRAWLLRAIWGLLNSVAKSAQCKGVLGESASAASSTLAFELPAHPFLYYVDQSCKGAPLDALALNVLFEIMIDEFHPDAHEPINVLSKLIKEVSVIPVTLHALSNCTVDACRVGLKNFVMLLQTGTNADTFIAQAGWQNWLFPLVCLYYKSSYFEDQASEQEVLNMGLYLLSNLHHNVIAQEAKGKAESSASYRLIASSLSKLRGIRGWSYNTIELARLLFSSVMELMKTHIVNLTNNFDYESGYYPCIFGILEAMVDFLFFMPLKLVSAGQGGETRLIAAAKKGDLSAVEQLIDLEGADPELSDSQGLTALDWALTNGHLEVAKFLKKPRDNELAQHATIHMGHSGGCLDLELVQKILQLLKAARLHDMASFDNGSGEKKSKIVKELEKSAKVWWEFFSEAEKAFQSLNLEHKSGKAKMFEQHVVQWLDDSSTIQCMDQTCRRQFSLRLRKHHCRTCGKIFCDDCCPKYPEGERLCRACIPVNEAGEPAIGSSGMGNPNNTHALTILRKLSQKLFEQQQFLKTGRTEAECSLFFLTHASHAYSRAYLREAKPK